jgi:hypothetical protein
MARVKSTLNRCMNPAPTAVALHDALFVQGLVTEPAGFQDRVQQDSLYRQGAGPKPVGYDQRTMGSIVPQTVPISLLQRLAGYDQTNANILSLGMPAPQQEDVKSDAGEQTPAFVSVGKRQPALSSAAKHKRGLASAAKKKVTPVSAAKKVAPVGAAKKKVAPVSAAKKKKA